MNKATELTAELTRKINSNVSPYEIIKDAVVLINLLNSNLRFVYQVNEMLIDQSKACIADIDPRVIVKHQDIDHLLEAIGAERVGEWFMGLGSR
ncbi:MAG: hypothetical protein JZU49_02935 [Sulfuricurvum sp.]|nr:hypothetical protein [Sulfuricurvum sp.]